MSATQQRLPLTPRQSAALKTALAHLLDGTYPPALDELSALREVAEKLDTLRTT